MLAANKKLHLDNDFDKIFKTGRSAYGRFLGVKSLNNNKNFSRFGLILGTKIDKSAVRRHLLKRRIFNIITKIEDKLPFIGDYVIIALPPIKEASSLELENELISLLGIRNSNK
ncbi:MAG TPA: ribonuclease P protein component [Candidatus Paceibacterota bacterium]|nr:ribonuclease P protein component [bacterium]HQM18725.1 ribonuclease P protein component [Candidatus Paceibacterota bacterium]